MGYRAVLPNVQEMGASPPGSRNGYWIATCPKHGETDHLSVLGGACSRCHHENLIARGLVKP